MPNIISNKFQKLNWLRDGFKKPWVSRMYRRPGETHMTHDLRCDICGKWYNYSTRDIPLIKAQDRWNSRLNRPFHCNNSLCQDYHQRETLHKIKMIDKMMRGEPLESKVL